MGGCCPSNVATTAMCVAHRLAPTHPRSQSLEAELGTSNKTPQASLPRGIYLCSTFAMSRQPPTDAFPSFNPTEASARFVGALAPLAPPPPTSSPMTVSLSQIRPRGARFSHQHQASETFASRLYFAPGGMSMRPRTGRWPDLGHGSDARAVRGRRRRER